MSNIVRQGMMVWDRFFAVGQHLARAVPLRTDNQGPALATAMRSGTGLSAALRHDRLPAYWRDAIARTIHLERVA